MTTPDNFNQPIFSLIPLMLEGKEDEIIQIINKGNFNYKEYSEGGRNLLSASLFLEKYHVADHLLKFSQDNNIVFNFYEQVDGFYQDIIQDAIYEQKKLEGFCSFVERYNLPIHQFNFVWYCRCINDKGLLQNDDYFSFFKQLCSLGKEHIIKLDPLETIMQLGRIGNKKLLELYYDICGFNQLSINDHPSFKLLKDVCLNAPHYFEYHSYHMDGIFTSKINQDKLDKLNDILSQIKDDYSFRDSFRGYHGKAISALSGLVEKNTKNTIDISLIDNLDSNQEYKNLTKKLSTFTQDKLAQISLVDKREHFKNRYLAEWPIAYFNDKTYAIKNSPNNQTDYKIDEQTKQKIHEKIHQLNLLGISFNKSIPANDVLYLLNQFMLETKELFPLEDNHVGNQQLWIDLFSDDNIENHKRSTGSLSHTNKNKIVLDALYHPYDHKKTINTLVHEYTHFLQFNNEESDIISNRVLVELQKESYQWIDFSKEDFAKFLLSKIGGRWGRLPNFIKENEQEFIEKIVLSLEPQIKNFEQVCLNSLQFIFNQEDYENYPDTYQNFKDNLNSLLYLVNIYNESQQRKDFSYEYYLWNYNKELQKYMNSPIEIHARFNQALHSITHYKEDISLQINPKKLEAMKEMISSFNHLYVNVLKKQRRIN